MWLHAIRLNIHIHTAAYLSKLTEVGCLRIKHKVTAQSTRSLAFLTLDLCVHCIAFTRVVQNKEAKLDDVDETNSTYM